MPYTHGHNSRFGDWMEIPLASPDMVENTLPWIEKSYRYVQIAPTASKRRVRRM
jgi:hypothetical protein